MVLDRVPLVALARRQLLGSESTTFTFNNMGRDFCNAVQ